MGSRSSNPDMNGMRPDGTSEETRLTRRDFLRVGAGGLALGLAAYAPAQAPAAGDKIDLGLIGVGAQGRVLLEAMMNIPGLNFRAVCDIWEYSRQYGERYLAKQGFEVTTYEDHRELLAKEKGLDAVIVATPDFWHAPIAADCLKAGLHVYCEKMMSNTIDGARSMVRAMKDSGKLLQIGHQRRSNPRYRHTAENLIRKAQLCGRITHVNGQWNRAVSADLGWPEKFAMDPSVLRKYGFKDMRQFRNWRWFRGLGGGPMSDLGAHQIDVYNWFLGGPPKRVMAGGGRDYYKDREWYDNVMAVYEYETPAGVVRAFYEVLTTTSAGGGFWEYFMGDSGSIKIGENPKTTRIYREAHAPDWEELVAKRYIQKVIAEAPKKQEESVDVRETAALDAYDLTVALNQPIHQPHLENFFNAVRGAEKLNCPADEAFASEYVVFKTNEAVEARKMIEITPEEYTA
jgi:predicted dehydrogenase